MTPTDTPPTPAPTPGASPGGVDAEAIPADSVFAIELRPLSLADPLRWLRAGWQDFRKAPAIGLFYGLCFMLMGWALIGVFNHAPVYTLALSAGFLLVGPLMCLGLYQVSYRLEVGQTPHLLDSLTAWRRRTGQIAIFGFVLLVLEMLWGRSALVVFAVSFNGMPDFAGSISKLASAENISFIIVYLAVGGVFASLIYAVSVIAMPMLLHRETDAITAGLTSMRLVLTQTAVMFVWGALLTLLVVLAMLPWFAGLIVVGPVVGHASWHAYRQAVVDAPSTAS
ncbi:hypothetical protein DBR47_02520 [Paucibacter sp. KBW04]|uniref:DUF2189 domain-containing protein n=1 Tax=Paucibacter sp. KBW04 TaxID=2153361 RepID=UPI000F58CB82|nr:DUF2189 domain-containing protein [Paucibacter sp. KBW04]RQO63430.1 hypothetical protein DBR47_02520 [Paucibacter sp. KBW04]